MRYVTVLGAGLLVGTALAVIIPEGVNALYMNEIETSHEHTHSVHSGPTESVQTISQKTNEQKETHEHKDMHSAIGVTLVLGFVFMLIVDNCSSKIFHHHGSQVVDSSGSVIINKPKATWTATLGLVVHAAADGIALGAASATSRFNVELIVFMAIILHKVNSNVKQKSVRFSIQ